MRVPKRPPQRKPRGPHPLNALTPAFVRNVSQSGRYCDGHGLYLYVRPTGSRGWIQRLTIRGRRTELGLGGFPLVSLTEAREKAFANRKLARDGGDPRAANRRAESMPSFADAAGAVWKQLRPGWRSPRHARLWLWSLERYVLPHIGKIPIAQVTSADVIGILAPIWHEKAATARKLRQRIRAVLEWAVAMDLRPDNPCDRIGPVLGTQGNAVRHMRALPHGEVASALRTVRASKKRPVVKLAFEFLVLTATRSGEVRGAAWKEIDQEEGVWAIPAPRTKVNREHRVPLARRALEILEEARALAGGSPLVFPGVGGKRIGYTAMADLLRGLRIAAVPHGFRSSFRDWVAEETDHPREVAEAALAHKVRNPVEAAYRRTDLFERRRRLMDDWAGYLDGHADKGRGAETTEARHRSPARRWSSPARRADTAAATS
ncbi:MAG: integrase arm-type DNA-binding domain-containing protein [Acidobacteriota bacterium]|nr:integrase arm-type DNA-binding domain-containing protein [Acidobacteriota bacterium]